MRRLAPVVILFLLSVLPGVTQAQTCTPPVVIVVGGTNPACAGQTVTLDAGPGWTTYQWSAGGATTRMISDIPSATTSYWVTTTDANGCTVTSQPLTVVVNAAPSAPSIQLRETTLCGGGQGEATVTGTWSSFAWSVTNGTIASGPNGPASNGATVDYTASGAGPVGVSVTVTDSNGCAVSTSTDVPLHTIAKPTVQTTPATICPGSFGDAWVNPPAEGGSWQSYHWTVLNGTIAQWSGDSGSTVGFTSSPIGQPVTVQVTVTDTYGCTATSDPVTIPVRTIAKPTVQTTPTTICPGSFGDAWVNPPAEGGSWQSYHWTVLNGTIAEWSGDSGSTVGFTSSPSGQPVTVQVTVTDTYGCTATSDPVTIPVRTIAKPTVQTTPTTICPGSFGDAWVNPPAEGGSWQNYHWTVLNGTIAQWSGDSSSTVGFTSSPSGQPVTVQVTVTDTYGCTATSDPVTIPVRSIAKPTVQTTPDAVCPGSFGDAWVNPPAEGGSWQNYHWTVTNGTIASWSGDSGSTVGFTSSPSGQPVTVQVTVTDTYGCTATSDPVTIPVRVLSPPAITVNSPSVCMGSYVQAHIDSPAYPNGPWQSVTWTATNAVRPSGGMTIPNDTSYFAIATGGPVTLTVAVTDMNGCSATSTIEIPVATNPPTAVMTAPANVCAGSVFTVTAHDPAGVVQNFQFYATNATNQSIEAGGSATFVANGPGPVDIYATTMDSSSTCAVYGHASTVAVTPVAATISASGPTALCPGGSVTLTAPDGMLTYNWSNGATTQAITVSGAGSYTVTVSNAPGCSSTSAPTNVTVATPATPAITAGGATTFCAGGSVTLTASLAASYLWSTGATTQSIVASASGSYSVAVTYASGCSATSSPTAVTVNSLPTATVAVGGPTTFCTGGSVTLTASSAVSYLWTTGATTQAIAVSTAGTYSVTVTDGSGCSATSPAVTVTINANPATPVVTANGPTTFCDYSSVGLTAPLASAYLWSNGATTRTIITSAGGDYTVTTTDANGCRATSAPTTITVLPRPVPTVTIPAQFCVGTTAHASVAETFAAYHWTAFNATIVGPADGPGVDFTSSTSVTANLFLTVTGANGCQWGYNNYSQAQPSVVPALNAPVNLCSTDTGNASFSPNPGSTWEWSITNGTITAYFDGQGQPASNGSSIFFVPLGPGIVTLTIVEHSVNGCTGTTTKNVTVQAPAPTDFTVSTTCPGGTGTASALLNYTFYTWSITNGSFIGNTFLRNVSFHMSSDPANPSVITFSGSNGPGGCLTPVTHTVPVATLAPPPIILFPDSGICTGNGVTAYTASSGYDSYHWTISNGTIYSGASSYLISYSANSGAPATLSLTVTKNGCSSSSSVVIPIADTTPPPITAPDSMCPNGTFTASVPTGYINYNWSFINAIWVGYSSSGNAVTLRPDASGLPIQLSVHMQTTGFCNVAASSKTIPIAATPEPQIMLDAPAGFCGGMTANASVTNGPYTTYSWSITGGILNGPANGPSVSFTADSSGSTIVSVAVTDGRGTCSSTGSLFVPFVNRRPQIVASSGSICAGGNATLSTLVAADSYLWSNGQTTPSITVTAVGDYTVTTTTAGCSFTSPPVHISLATPSVTVSADRLSHCPGSSSVLTTIANGFSSYPLTYTWYATDQQSPVNSGYYQLFANSTNTRTFYCVVSDGRGCSARSNDITITVYNPTAVITPSGPATFCAGGSVTLTANAGSSYSWSTGATTQSITVSSSGSYNVYVVDTNGCGKTSASTIVTVNPLPATPTITAGGPTTFCAGGSVTLTASSGASSYLWSNGATTQAITVNASGNYSVTVANGSGCSATSSPTVVTVNALPGASITADGPITFCAGGSVTLTASSGSSYLWSTGATTQSIVANTSGSYSVTVTGANGCAATSSPTVVSASNPAASITAGGPTTFCAGGSVTLTASSGASYLWSTGATTSSIVASSSGSYSVTVADANGCNTTSAPTSVTVNTNPPASITVGGPATFCAGGSVTLTASSGASYLWSNGATTQSISASTTGNYSVTITNASGCIATSSPTVVTANANPPATITAGGPTTFCAGGSVTLTASSGVSYLWSNGATTSSITTSASGSYSVTITNASGCSATSSPTAVTVNANPTATITPGGPTTFCTGGSVTLTASSGATYLWSTGATTQAITVNVSGNYRVTVTGANGCSATSSPTTVSVNANPTATITAGGPTTFCTGGAVVLTASSGASYLWSTGDTSPSIAIFNSGSFSVTVTNSSGCSVTSSPTTVTVNANPTVTITAGGPTTFCAGGSVTLTASSGGSYLWSNGATTQSIAASTSGNYTVNVTNANGCSATSSPTTVTVNANPTAGITAGGPTTFCAGGSVTLTASSGTSYLWSTGATTPSIAASASGNYSVTVTNANGCSATSSPTAVTVNTSPAASITAGGPTTFCAGGSVTLTASSGTSYLWSTGATTQSIAASTSGNYTVTVTNANGCSATSSPTTVTVNANPTANINPAGSVGFCEGGSLTLTASSGSSYLWSNGATTQSINVNAGGSYSVNVTNANGCSATSSPTTVTVNPAPAAVITPSGPTSFCTGGSVTLTASSGASYLWSNGATTQSITVNASGGYQVTVKYANFCSRTSPLTNVTVNPNPTAFISTGGPTTFCAGGSLTLTASSGASYLWSNGATTQVISATTSGNYSVTVTDANGCSATSTPLSVTVNPNPIATITAGGPTTFCAGGSVTLTASAGSSYFWSNGATTQSISVSTSGNYNVIVNQSTGCSSTSAATTVTVNAAPTATITAGGPTTFCAGGSVTLTASSGSSYLWSNGATTPSISANASGNYSVTVTNANGCSAASSPTTVTINASPVANITAGGPTTFCTGGSVTLTASSGSSYLWSNGATTASITVSASNNYAVTVTNANGCSATSSPTTVTVRPLPTSVVSGGGAICPGGSTTITATLTGTAPWSVKWSDNVIQTINSGTTATRSVSPASGTTYTVILLSDANCTGTSSGSAAVTIKTLPTAVVSGGGTICPGGSATITATLTGTAPWSVTWSDGNIQTINSGTTATRSVSPASTTIYTVTSVSDAKSCPVTGSGSATVTRNTAASITTQPANATTTRNTNVTLSVVAAGTSPISYQWFKGNGSSISGATSSSYTTSFPNKGTNTFYVQVWNSCNTTHVQSNTVTITVN